MKLKLRYAKKDEIPQGFEALYSEVNGEWVLTEVEGMKTQTDVDNVLEGLRKEREDHQKTKDKLKVWDGLDPEETRTKLDRLPELEAAAAGGSDETKISTLVEARIHAKTAPLERKISTLEKENADKDAKITTFEQQNERRVIHDHIRKAATATKMLPSAVEDALLLGERIFTVNEEGKPVARDQVGVTPGIEPEVWLTEIQTSRTHWWPQSQGAGSLGGDGQGGPNNPWSDKHWNMTQQGIIYKQDANKAEQMAKAAGTTVGGPRPVSK